MTAGRLIGLDHGIKRIGIAISDPLQIVARELMILTRRSREEDFAAINTIASQHQVVGFVIGMPVNRDLPENMHSQADTVRLWISRFQQTTPLPIIEWEEALTSVDAQELARQKRRKPGAPIDDLAARLILQSYLDALHAGLVQPVSSGDSQP
jgi:putative Holliday junction resolvase